MIREWLIEARKKRGLTQKEFGDLLKLSPQVISKAELGQPIKIATAKKLAAELDIEWQKFYEN